MLRFGIARNGSSHSGPTSDLDRRVIVIGGGPAGLTAAYQLARSGLRPIVLEQSGLVGGLARTENYKGFRFDMGGHRFYTKSEDVKKLWHEVLGDDLLHRSRLSRIYYRNKFFAYPLRPLGAFKDLGVIESARIVASYLRWQLFPSRDEKTFEQWVTNRFGKRLFLTFFKSYTEKVWGIPCSTISAEWAAQRIKDLSLKTALLSRFVRPRKVIRTLIDDFHYPRLGPGMMWNTVKELVERRGGTVQLNSPVVRIERNKNRIERVIVASGGRQHAVAGGEFLSSMPITELVKQLDPPAPARVLKAAANLRYRDFLVVGLIVDRPALFPDNWIYVHDPGVRVGRIQNFKNWSPDMVPDLAKSSVGLEYFCSAGDDLWTMADADLIELGKHELERIGLASAATVEDGCVFRIPKAYPVYDSNYREQLEILKDFVEGLENLQTLGRNGLHRYNNQDHAMLTGMLAVRNLFEGRRHDLWSVNVDQDYLEEVEIADRAVKPVKGSEQSPLELDTVELVTPERTGTTSA
jgi:protoporphyrinogen oxidase